MNLYSLKICCFPAFTCWAESFLAAYRQWWEAMIWDDGHEYIGPWAYPRPEQLESRA